MKLYNDALAGLAVLTVVCFGLAARAHAAENQGFDIDRLLKTLGNLQLVNESERGGATRYELEGANTRLRLQVTTGIDSGSAGLEMEEGLLGVKAVYANALSAYPGQVSNEIKCHEKFLPVFREKRTKQSQHRYIFVFSSARFGLGACSDDLVRYKHLIGWTYCPQNKQLLNVRYFAPLQEDFTALEKIFFKVSNVC